MIRFIVPIMPMYDSVYLRPEGREFKKVRVNAFNKTKLYYPGDFLLEPVVIIRLDENYVPFDNFSKYIFSLKNQSSGFTYTDSTMQKVGSLFIGKRTLLIGDEIKNAWLKDLDGMDAETSNIIFEKWKSNQLFSQIDLEIGDILEITFNKKSDSTKVHQITIPISGELTDRVLRIQ